MNIQLPVDGPNLKVWPHAFAVPGVPTVVTDPPLKVKVRESGSLNFVYAEEHAPAAGVTTSAAKSRFSPPFSGAAPSTLSPAVVTCCLVLKEPPVTLMPANEPAGRPPLIRLPRIQTVPASIVMVVTEWRVTGG